MAMILESESWYPWCNKKNLGSMCIHVECDYCVYGVCKVFHILDYNPSSSPCRLLCKQEQSGQAQFFCFKKAY